MIEIYKKTMEYDIRQRVNFILHWIRKILRRKSTSYTYHGLKDILVALTPIYDIVNEFLKNGIGLGIQMGMVFIFSRFFDREPTREEMITSFLSFHFVVCILANTGQIPIIERGNRLNLFREYFHMDPGKMLRSIYYLRMPISLLSQMVLYFILAKIFSVPLFYAVAFPLLSYTLAQGNLFWQNTYFSWKKGMIRYKTWILLTYYIALVLLALAMIYFPVIPIHWILASPILILWIGLGGYFAYRNYRFSDYGKFLERSDIPQKDLGEGEDFSKTVALEVSRVEEKDQRKSHKVYEKKLEGYAFLNELFFQRHRRHIFRPILIKSLIAGVVFLGILIGVPFFLGMEVFYKETKELFMALINALPFVSYMLYSQENITKIMFINCDESLLEYGFYQRPKDLLTMFTLRLKKLLLWNGLPLSIVIVGMTAAMILAKGSLSQILILIGMALLLYLFFSVHTLFVYYYFQPYTSNYSVKSPVFGVVQFLSIYLICYMPMTLDVPSIGVLLFFVGMTAIYLPIALYLVYKKSPKRFRLRRE
ncbi:hypothetical protein LQU94_05630 [Peptoniphilus sp. KCTC 25270]|uniref:hypothetical protein n=1 Tax=Peptoniphilus sp. KCTC 25270 TaxID=2897414 RepID=UPI001E645708|nr:hypothetical protein [Peptoniphilus sp. KCTC 25270]MCD1147591.1 hypothetical protein [Peptoniphilus sp. KCTC 25270]